MEASRAIPTRRRLPHFCSVFLCKLERKIAVTRQRKPNALTMDIFSPKTKTVKRNENAKPRLPSAMYMAEPLNPIRYIFSILAILLKQAARMVMMTGRQCRLSGMSVTRPKALSSRRMGMPTKGPMA